MEMQTVVSDDKKHRYWGEERNERRRQRYRLDVEYRKKVREQTRQTYRRQKQAEGQKVRHDNCADNIPLLSSIGTVRAVLCKDSTRKNMLTFTVEEMAKAFDRNQQVLYRWFAADMFPRPAAAAETEYNKNQPVYTKSEAVAAMREFSRHQDESQYYREKHVDTRDRIYSAIYSARAELASVAFNAD